MDRFVSIELHYDEELELKLALAEHDHDDTRAWVAECQRKRNHAISSNLPILITPRASVNGAKLLRAQVPIEMIRDMTIHKGCSPDTINQLNRAV
jgi:hypothetical protein